ncbi:hypothetical protein OsI_29905 [Oryza sativa Indica Group]|uniref:Uncharacterized protein n=2 Tax=Oryza sativa TaxID=4530 RepID=B9G1T9_ORYSJ|nr:hypothetical protein OsI_29905 [Oryza sativa Indica Group]EEE69006.1 hypothetical protein OsJ_27953 [Oryza sativa Japonica Group]
MRMAIRCRLFLKIQLIIEAVFTLDEVLELQEQGWFRNECLGWFRNECFEEDKMETQGQMHVEQGIQSQDMMRVLSSEKVLKMQETHNVTGHGEGFKLRKGSEDAGDTQYKY